MELETQLQLVERLGYLPENEVARVLDSTANTGRMLSSLLRRLTRNPRQTSDPQHPRPLTPDP